MRLAEIAQILSSSVAPKMENLVPLGYSIDSRTVRAGELFVAIKGEFFDGHNFVAAALARGAVAAIVAQPLPNCDNERLIIVDDTLLALQTLASAILKQWGRPIIGITGSAGKTTTKELTALVLSLKGRVLKSIGNLNNSYGLPLAVLQMETDGHQAAEFDFAVLEMGMSSPGEIRRLCEIAPPHVGAVLNVYAVHLEFFESIEAIAQAKAELVEGLRPNGLAVLNADDPLVIKMRSRHNGPVQTFGIDQAADVQAVDVQAQGLLGSNFRLIIGENSALVQFPLAGRHLIYNALIAATIGHHFGLTVAEIAQGLAQAHPAKHRGELLRFTAGFAVVDDSYNANPKALNEMVEMLAQVPGFKRHILIAGEMLELGEAGAEMHQDCGRYIAAHKVDVLIGVRGLAEDLVKGATLAGLTQAYFLENAQAATQWLKANIQAGDLVLIKGSRGVKLDSVIDELCQSFKVEEN